MDSDSPIPDETTLRKMPYSELREMAKKHGIKSRKSMKAEKLITNLLASGSSDEMDSFSTPMAKALNSSKKNKERQFNVDAMTPLPTPRRGTYSVETPIFCIESEKMEADSSSSPAIPLTPPVLDISNVTVLRGSERKLRPRKVSFVSPKKMTPRTPTKYISLKDRPKTPVPSKSKRMSLTAQVQQKSDSNKKLAKLSGSATRGEADSKLKREATPSCAPKSAGRGDSTKMKRIATPNFKRIHEKAFEKMESIDDYQQRKLKESVKKLAVTSKSKNKVTKPKTKIPVPFAGVPFIPSVTSTTALKFNFSTGIPKSFTGEKRNQQKSYSSTRSKAKQKSETENCVLIKSGKKPKFDLQASLSKKLGYRPYTGPLKPLCDSNCMNSPLHVCQHGSVKETVNPTVYVTRDKSRSALRGVRTNRRFELHMKNRKLE